MEKYYFTFGSWEKFPYKNAYLVVVASGFDDAVAAFRKKYPDVHENCLNCSFWYSEEKWEKIKESYADQRPAEVIWTETCFGKKPGGYGDIFVFVPDVMQIIRIAEGNGSNLLEEDEVAGYVDYIYYEQHDLDIDMPEVDGGQILLKEMFRDKYRCTADCIPAVLEMAYGNCLIDCMILG